MCISYEIPKIKTCEKKKKFRKGKLEGSGAQVGRSEGSVTD
jgi:hypothetical protein